MSLNVDWHHYNTLVERLALKVHESGFRFNQLICIARGGLRVGDVLSRIFDQPLAILSTHSYTSEGGTIRGELVIAEHMTMIKPRLGDRVLLVDDMVDSGHTLAAVHDELPRRFPHIVELRTAVLWWKACSVFKPDYYVDYLADSPWIHQQFEVYDDLDRHIQEMRYDVRAFGFDPYNAKEFVERWEQENGPFGIEKVPQGARTESVPLGELKKLAEQRLLIFDEGLMTFTMGNAITLEDTNGNRKLLKKRTEEKIDNVAALMDAYVAYKANKEAFE
jgi:hypoxanthine phosphoribosyltransferase